MQLYSTLNPSRFFTLEEAVLKGLPDDGGLFMPVDIPRLPDGFLQNLTDFEFPEIGYEISSALFKGCVPEKEVRDMVFDAIDFPAPLIDLGSGTYSLELFHGPSLAFKDFGARFMARLMAFFNRNADRPLTILVATSGDTGGAVAAGFFRTPGIRVVILYPSGRVSGLQEKQLTTFGENVSAIEVSGSFDDCQTLVKKAFLDQELNERLRLSSANSINIARLIPQSFYYFEALKQLPGGSPPPVFSVPSGNFGNLTAGLIAQRMGLPVDHFLAACNANDVFPDFLLNGEFRPKPSVQTLSNAMDVGNPSNFQRILDLFGSTWNQVRSRISGYSISDQETLESMRRIFSQSGYICDPHGGVGFAALRAYQPNGPGIVLETAHPAKFGDVVLSAIGTAPEIPGRLAKLANIQKQSVPLAANFANFRDWLLENC